MVLDLCISFIDLSTRRNIEQTPKEAEVKNSANSRFSSLYRTQNEHPFLSPNPLGRGKSRGLE
jgi:hypothetical protein